MTTSNTPANGGARPIYRWAGMIDGKPDLDALYSTKAEAKVYYSSVCRVEVRVAGRVNGLRGRQFR